MKIVDMGNGTFRIDYNEPGLLPVPKKCRCRQPDYSFNDDGRGWCRACHGWEPLVSMCHTHRITARVCPLCERDDVMDRQSITTFPEWEDENGTPGVLP